MRRLEAFFAATWTFVVGDDWRSAVGVTVALALTALLATTSIAAWWVMPVAVGLLLWMSIRRAARDGSHEPEPSN
jgi:hypothetical protein